MTERSNDHVCTGWIPAIEKRATKAQLIALRDYLLSIGWGNSAAAVDNAIDCIQSDADMARRIEMASEGTYPSPIIYGGEVLEITPQTGGDDIPF